MNRDGREIDGIVPSVSRLSHGETDKARLLNAALNFLSLNPLKARWRNLSGGKTGLAISPCRVGNMPKSLGRQPIAAKKAKRDCFGLYTVFASSVSFHGQKKKHTHLNHYINVFCPAGS